MRASSAHRNSRRSKSQRDSRRSKSLNRSFYSDDPYQVVNNSRSSAGKHSLNTNEKIDLLISAQGRNDENNPSRPTNFANIKLNAKDLASSVGSSSYYRGPAPVNRPSGYASDSTFGSKPRKTTRHFMSQDGKVSAKPMTRLSQSEKRFLEQNNISLNE